MKKRLEEKGISESLSDRKGEIYRETRNVVKVKRIMGESF